MQSQTFYLILLFHKTNFILHRIFYKYYTKQYIYTDLYYILLKEGELFNYFIHGWVSAIMILVGKLKPEFELNPPDE